MITVYFGQNLNLSDSELIFIENPCYKFTILYNNTIAKTLFISKDSTNLLNF